MRVSVEKVTSEDLIAQVCAATTAGGGKTVTFERMLGCGHSPIRTQNYVVTLVGVPTFVSVHLVRHKFGVEHFVRSNRDDRGGDKNADRNTPVTHVMFLNAQALINMSVERLCYNAHRTTVAVMIRIRRAVAVVDPVMARFMVPECVYKNGCCTELTMCKPGLANVLGMYPQWPGHRLETTER